MNNNDDSRREFFLTPVDIRRAADEDVLSHDDATRLIEWGYAQRFNQTLVPPPAIAAPAAVEQRKGFNLVTIAYYVGAFLMISACAWFLGDKWDALGKGGVLITTLLYMLLAGGLGWWLRGKGYAVGGGLLVTVAVCLVPLLTYTIEDILGVWPGERPGEYEDFYPWIHGSWIVLELATIAAALLALRFVPFGFLTAPLAFSFWFFSMDIAAWAWGRTALTTQQRAWVSVVVGLIILLIGYGLERTMKRRGAHRSEDFAFWCYLFGMFAFWGGLTAMNGDSELNRALYALLNIGLIGLAVKLRRAVFLVFGVIGVHLYLGHLAYKVFQDSLLFPFALALLGLSLILITVLAQRHMNQLVGRRA